MEQELELPKISGTNSYYCGILDLIFKRAHYALCSFENQAHVLMLKWNQSSFESLPPIVVAKAY